MSVVDAATRAAIEERAGFRCEYCRLPVRGQIGAFPIDQPMPRSSGGLTIPANLALACPHCNGHKWAHTFAEGKTTRGRATLLLLQMNHPNMVDIRLLLVALNLFPA